MLLSTDFFLIFLNILAICISYFIINNKNLINAILLLILLLVIITFISFIYNAKFLALLFIIIYVGAVLVLFLFTIMLLGYKEDQKFEKKKYLFFFFFIFSLFYSILHFETLLGLIHDKNLLYSLNLKKTNFVLFTHLNSMHLNFLENLNKIGHYVFIDNPKIIIYSTIILLIGMIASINISKLNNNLLKNQQKEIQIKRKIKDSINLLNEI